MYSKFAILLNILSSLSVLKMCIPEWLNMLMKKVTYKWCRMLQKNHLN